MISMTLQLGLTADGTMRIVMLKDVRMPAVPRVGDYINMRLVTGVVWESYKDDWRVTVKLEPWDHETTDDCRGTRDCLIREGWTWSAQDLD
jgi:hypothetical protein